MLYSKKTDYLMESIRLGRDMARREKLNLIVGLSIPSMLAQISTVMMFFIDASMVGHLGAEASASIGLIESTTWLIGSLLSASGAFHRCQRFCQGSTGFSSCLDLWLAF